MRRLNDRGEADFVLILAGIVVVLFLVFGTFACSTRVSNENVETITVTEKERVQDGDTSRYLIFTEDDGVFENTDSLFHGKFNSSDVYGQIEPGKTYEVTTFGYRIPFLSMYPNIVEIEVVDE